MTPATALEWLDTLDYAPSPTARDLQEFFGIPPSPPEDLDANIREKRKHWKKRQQKARVEELERRAEAVLQAIAEAEDALKRGATASGGGQAAAEAADRAPKSVDDVWQELERLLFRGRYVDALSRAREYEGRWSQYPRFVDIRSEVILEAVQNLPGFVPEPGLLESAIAGVRQVITDIEPTEARYLTLIELLEASGRPAEIPAVFAEAVGRLPRVSASFRVRELELRFSKEQWRPALRYCVELVKEAGNDRALRSELVQMIIGRAIAELLPLSSVQAVQQYQEVVATAAWIADGVPEAEDFVRVHRMWASNAGQPVFGGNWQWRAFFAIITLFIALPLINSAMARPAWQVLLTGPALGETKKSKSAVKNQNQSWFMVTRNMYIEPVHQKCKLPWQEQPGQWPQLDISKLFNF